MFQDAYSFMMSNEDSTYQYKTVPDAPPDAFAISGINSVAFPSQFNAINAIPQSERGPAVQQFYQTTFWNTWLNQIICDDLASRVFDSAVNMGPGTSVKLLQEAVNTIIPNCLTVDGAWGPNTILHTNSVPQANIVDAFRTGREQYYRNIVAKNPNDQQYLNGWLARASK